MTRPTIRYLVWPSDDDGTITVRAAGTLDEALREVTATDPSRWSALQERCSYLVDGVTTRDRSTELSGVGVVDVMPPFAGG